MAAARRRNRVLAVVGTVAFGLVVMHATATLLRACNIGPEPTATEAPALYLDPKFGFSLEVDPRFPQDAPAGRIDSGLYSVGWTARDSPKVDGFALDLFVVTVRERGERVSGRVVTAEIRSMLSHPRQLEAALGGGAKLIRAWKTTVDGVSAAAFEAMYTMPSSGARVRVLFVDVPMRSLKFTIGGIASPDTWSRNLPAFEAMIASVRLPNER